mgnify:CR=1 FL=1
MLLRSLYTPRGKVPRRIWTWVGQSHIPVACAAIVANTGKAGAGEKYFRRWDGDGISEFSIFVKNTTCW